MFLFGVPPTTLCVPLVGIPDPVEWTVTCPDPSKRLGRKSPLLPQRRLCSNSCSWREVVEFPVLFMFSVMDLTVSSYNLYHIWSYPLVYGSNGSRSADEAIKQCQINQDILLWKLGLFMTQPFLNMSILGLYIICGACTLSVALVTLLWTVWDQIGVSTTVLKMWFDTISLMEGHRAACISDSQLWIMAVVGDHWQRVIIWTTKSLSV